MTMTVAPRASRTGNRCDQRRFAVLIEKGIGLVENNQSRFAIECPCKGNPLRLAGRQAKSHQAKLGIIAFGQVEDQFVDSGFLGGSDHRIVDAFGFLLGLTLLEAGDILLDRPFEQGGFLGHVAKIGSELVLVPVSQPRPVNAHGPNRR